jgi:manganese oxidase
VTITGHADTAPEQQPKPETGAQPAPPPPLRPGFNTDTVALGALFVAIFAFLAALVAVGLASRSIDEHRAVQAGEVPAETSAAGGTVSLSEFSISPDPVEISAGETLAVTNDGTIVHNLSVEGNTTPMLEPGGSATLDLSSLAPGSYTLICDVAGHAAAGMQTTLNVG